MKKTLEKRTPATVRLVSLLLAMVLVVTMVPALAFAGADEQPVVPTTEDAGSGGTEGEGTESTNTVEGEGTGEVPVAPAPVSEGENLQALNTQSEGTAGLGEIMPMAVGDPVNAQIVADNGTINFDSASDAATISYASDAEQSYDMTVVVTFPSNATSKTLDISLAEGLKFTVDGSSDTNVTKWLVGGAAGITDTPNTDPYGGSADMANTGSKTYSFIDGASVATLDLKISADSRYWFDSAITDGIVMTLSDSTQTYEVKMESVTVDSGSKNLTTYPGDYTGSVALDEETDILSSYRKNSFVMGSLIEYPHFLSSAQIILTVDDENTVVKNTDSANWDMADNGGGVYTFTPKVLPTLAGAFIVPVSFEFPADSFSDDDVVVITREPSATLYGGKTVVWPSQTFTFTINDKPSEVFVNYGSVIAAQANSSLSTTTTANMGTVSDTMSGVLGYYTVGNRGSLPSGEKVVELNFDSTKLGVVALHIPIPPGDAVTEIEYQTVNSGDAWQTAVVSLSNGAYSYSYVSYATLGLADPFTTGNYLTAIRYKLDSVPALSALGIGSSNHHRNGIYGYVLDAGLGQTATSTVSVYDPGADKSSWTTGNIISNNASSYAGMDFTEISTAQVQQDAGTTFSFTQRNK